MGRYATTKQWMWCLFYLFVFILAYGALLFSGVDGLSLILCVALGALVYLVIAGFCHDAAHGSLSKKTWVNKVFLHVGFGLIGVSGHLWKYRHLRKHHPFPNVKGSDVDADSSSLIRLSPHNEWKPLHRYQVYYAPFLYSLVLQSVAWQEDFVYLKKSMQEQPKVFATRQFLALFISSKLIHLCLFVLIPLMMMPISIFEWLLGYIIVTSVASFIFVMINVGSHITEECEFSKPDEAGKLDNDWVEQQLNSSVDWSPQNKFFVVLTGGANSHAAHHLFPHTAHCHNSELCNIVESICTQFNYKYNKLTFLRMLKSHWFHLRNLSKPPIHSSDVIKL